MADHIVSEPTYINKQKKESMRHTVLG